MSLYQPNRRVAQQANPCGNNHPGPCGPGNCGPIPGNDLNCCPTTFPQRQVCPVEVYVPGCEPGYDQPLDGRVNCDCIPCLDEVAFTQEQKMAVRGIIEGLLKNISPYAFSCCQVVDPQGHAYPLAPRPLVDAETGEKLYNYTGSNATILENNPYSASERDQLVADNPGVTAGQFVIAVEDCCDIPCHSAFVNYGLAAFGAMGISGVNAAPIGDLSSIEGHERLGKLMCCALDKVFGAPTLELVDTQPGPDGELGTDDDVPPTWNVEGEAT